VRDFAWVQGDGVIREAVTAEALARLDIDACGLDAMDRMILHAIVVKFRGGPVGLETLAASVSEEADTLTDVYEPFLLKLGFLQKTPRGRVATELAYRHLGLAVSRPMPAPEPALFLDSDPEQR
jgi:Holliday junction DNA helicase RuvB